MAIQQFQKKKRNNFSIASSSTSINLIFFRTIFHPSNDYIWQSFDSSIPLTNISFQLFFLINPSFSFQFIDLNSWSAIFVVIEEIQNKTEYVHVSRYISMPFDKIVSEKEREWRQHLTCPSRVIGLSTNG